MNFIDINLLIFDYFIIIITLIIVLFSFWKGVINSILGLLTWVGSVFITIYTYTYLSNYLLGILKSIDFLSGFEQFISIISIIISIPLIFLISLIILKRIRKGLSSGLDKQILGLIFDKFFGIIYGIIFSYIIFSTIIYFTQKSDITILKNFNNFIVQNSNILLRISDYNENIFEVYNNKEVN